MIGYLIGLLLSNLAYFALHITGASSFPRPLSEKEEQKALEQMKNGDKEAREKLINHNLRLVAHLAKKYYSVSKDTDDLISVGTVGLRPTEKFPPCNIYFPMYRKRNTYEHKAEKKVQPGYLHERPVGF